MKPRSGSRIVDRSVPARRFRKSRPASWTTGHAEWRMFTGRIDMRSMACSSVKCCSESGTKSLTSACRIADSGVAERSLLVDRPGSLCAMTPTRCLTISAPRRPGRDPHRVHRSPPTGTSASGVIKSSILSVKVVTFATRGPVLGSVPYIKCDPLAYGNAPFQVVPLDDCPVCTSGTSAASRWATRVCGEHRRTSALTNTTWP
jgi:hypothetical protein